MPTQGMLVSTCRRAIYAAIEAERDRQVALGYDAAHDDKLAGCQWVTILSRQLGLLADDAGEVQGLALVARQLVRIGAVCTAALEALARAGLDLATLEALLKTGQAVRLDGFRLAPTEEPYDDHKPVPVLAPEERSRIG